MASLKEEFEEANANVELAKVKRETTGNEKDRVQKIVEELHRSKEECFSTAQCCEMLKICLSQLGCFQEKNNSCVVTLLGRRSGLKAK